MNEYPLNSFTDIVELGDELDEHYTDCISVGTSEFLGYMSKNEAKLVIAHLQRVFKLNKE